MQDRNRAMTTALQTAATRPDLELGGRRPESLKHRTLCEPVTFRETPCLRVSRTPLSEDFGELSRAARGGEAGQTGRRNRVEGCWLGLGRASLGVGLRGVWLAIGLCVFVVAGRTQDVRILDVPDYQWESGCFGTATGNLMGFWDRNGFPDFYTGPTGGGVAPLNDYGSNSGIWALWASKAGRDSRPHNVPGHVDDYYVAYESTAADPYLTAGRAEHAPDCIGDYIGLSQKKWTNLDGECDGNIDAYCFNFWDKTGARRWNYTPEPVNGIPVQDVQSGLRAWTAARGYAADTCSQLPDFSAEIAGPGQGFSFEDLRAEIDAGYPVLIFLQNWQQQSRPVGDMARANPSLHGMLAVGYSYDAYGQPRISALTSWGVGLRYYYQWRAVVWEVNLQVRGVIVYHPKPRIVAFERGPSSLTLRWHGPRATLYDARQQREWAAHWYVVERSSDLGGAAWAAVSEPTSQHEVTIPECCPGTAFYRLKVVPAPQ